MTIFERIRAATRGCGLEAFPDTYKSGDLQKWVTFNTIIEQGVNYGDDHPSDTRVDVQIHLFIPGADNYIGIKNILRRALFAQGFSWPEVTFSTTELGSGIRHIVMECEITEHNGDDIATP